jgi:uncharacterized surface protein with fasciclin (FAS1) repeats
MKRTHFIQGFVFAATILALLPACKKPNLTIPPQAGSVGTISNYLSTNFDLSLFYAAVQKAGLEDSLDHSDGEFTVFAPLNSAFNKDGIYRNSDLDNWTTDSVKAFVRTYILARKLFYKDIPTTSDTRYTNLNGIDLYVSEGYLFPLTVNGVAVLPSGSLASSLKTFGITQLNGLVYPIQNTLKISLGTVQELIASMPDLSHLQAGLKKFGLWDMLGKTGPFTVVAPVDTAFERYGLTLDSIARLNTANYDPVLFGIYEISPNHIYLTDVAQIQEYKAAAFQTVSDSLALVMSCEADIQSSMNSLAASVTRWPIILNQGYRYVGPTYSGSFGIGSGAYFLGEPPSIQCCSPTIPPNGKYTNYTCANGVVHLLSGILLRPSDVQKH